MMIQMIDICVSDFNGPLKYPYTLNDATDDFFHYQNNGKIILIIIIIESTILRKKNRSTTTTTATTTTTYSPLNYLIDHLKNFQITIKQETIGHWSYLARSLSQYYSFSYYFASSQNYRR